MKAADSPCASKDVGIVRGDGHAAAEKGFVTRGLSFVPRRRRRRARGEGGAGGGGGEPWSPASAGDPDRIGSVAEIWISVAELRRAPLSGWNRLGKRQRIEGVVVD
jgi:hypothetical protein